MNKRQKKKRFKKLYGSNPEEFIKMLHDFDWQGLAEMIVKAFHEFWEMYLEYWKEFYKEIENANTEKIAVTGAETDNLQNVGRLHEMPDGTQTGQCNELQQH